MIAQLAPLAPAKQQQSGINTYAATWNNHTPNQRKKLMQEAGYQSNYHYSHRAWAFIPYAIRQDVIAVIKKQKQASTPAPATHVSNLTALPVRKRYWWVDKELEAVDD